MEYKMVDLMAVHWVVALVGMKVAMKAVSMAV